MGQHSQKEEGKADAESARRNTNQHGFGEQLTDDAASARPECNPHSQFLHAIGRTRQQQACGIAACDQQDDTNSAQEQQQQRPNRADGDVQEAADQGTQSFTSPLCSLSRRAIV